MITGQGIHTVCGGVKIVTGIFIGVSGIDAVPLRGREQTHRIPLGQCFVRFKCSAGVANVIRRQQIDFRFRSVSGYIVIEDFTVVWCLCNGFCGFGVNTGAVGIPFETVA